MAENKKQAALPILQKPPGYKESTNDPITKPVARPGPPRPKPGAPRPKPGAPRPKPGPPRPKPVSLPPSFKPPVIKMKKRRNSCRICCCISSISILIVAILLFILGGLFYLWFNPKFPVFHLQSFKLPSFNVTVKPDGSYLTATAAAMVGVNNPNQKLTFRYGASEVRLTVVGRGEDEDVSFGPANLGGFNEGGREKRSLKIAASVKNAQVWPRILSEFRKKELVVRVEVKTHVGSRVWGRNIGMLGINVWCGDTTVKQLDNGDMPKCVINTLKWINIH